MNRQRPISIPGFVLVACLTTLASAASGVAASDYDDLVELFEDFRTFQDAMPAGGIAEYTPAAVAEQYRGLL